MNRSSATFTRFHRSAAALRVATCHWTRFVFDAEAIKLRRSVKSAAGASWPA
jgi:hypothetical protein